MTGRRHLRRIWRALRNRSGGVAVIFALALPVLIALVAGGVDLMSVSADRTLSQDVADSAALSAAKQLGLSDPAAVEARAKAFVDTQLAPLTSRFTYTVTTTTAADNASVTVTVDGRRTSFFANLLPPGGWKINVSATASAMGRAPLCVLVSGLVKQDKLDMKNTARITAPNCMVHANGDISVANAGWLQAGVVQSAGLATGRISPAAMTGAPVFDDPFATMDLSLPPTLASTTQSVLSVSPIKVKLADGTTILCNPTDLLLDAGVTILAPGVHCGAIKVVSNATLRLMPGEHYFAQSRLSLSNASVLKGDDVALIFDNTSDFNFTDTSEINLSGRKTGKFAGFVVVTTRENLGTFKISSTSARQLLGTIYIPNATLEVTGASNSVADQSAWTVVVAKSIKMSGSPNLVINANYAGSSVPVPTGVGGSANQVALSK